MTAHLRLVSDNPIPAPNMRLDGRALYQLADSLTREIRAGHSEAAHYLAAHQKLSPFGIAIIATRMTQSGLSERQILEAVL